MQPNKQTLVVPELQTFLRHCRSGDQQSLCTGQRTVYKTVERTVYKKTEVVKIEYLCCPGWAREKPKLGCTKAVCKDDCNNQGVCVQPGTCRCHSGWTGSSCQQDINECLSKNSGCQHECVNKAGSYQCRCNEGFLLSEDGRKCEHIPTYRREMRDLNLRLEAIEEIMPRLSKIFLSVSGKEDSPSIFDGKQEGKPGPPGPKGDKGERGEKGERGLKGEKGEPGEAAAPWSRLPASDVFSTLVEKVASLEARLEQCGCHAESLFDVSRHPRDPTEVKDKTKLPGK